MADYGTGNGRETMVRLNDANFADWAEKRPPLTLVLVRSAACAQSLELEAMLSETAPRFSGRVRVASVDMDESPETLRRHKVEGVPTMLLFRDGRQVGALRSCSVAVAELDRFIARADEAE
jgi:thioredoxin 1